MAPKRVQKSRSRQTTPQSPPKQNLVRRSPSQSQSRTRSKTPNTVQTADLQKQLEIPLPAVEEEERAAIDSENEIEVVEPNPPSELDQFESAADTREVTEDDVDDTSSDGTTQLETLDIDLIVDGLAALFQDASQILSLFHTPTAAEVFHDINKPLSKILKRLDRCMVRINADREVYGNGSYINVPLILRKLTGNPGVNNGPWRPDSVLQLANLSLLLASLAQKEERIVRDALDQMFNTFPEPFGHFHLTVDRARYNAQSASATVSFGIALRTQFFIKVVEESIYKPTFDPDSVLKQVFFRDGNLTGFHVEGEEISSDTEKRILEHLRTVRKYFKKSSKNPINLAQLKQDFSWRRFFLEALQWSLLQRQELESQIVAQGGLDAIINRLEQNDFAPYKSRAPYAVTSSETSEGQAVELLRSAHSSTSIQETPRKATSSRLSVPTTMARNIARLKQHIAVDDDESSEASQDNANADQQIFQQNSAREQSRQQHSIVQEIPQSPEVTNTNGRVEDGADDGFLDGDDGEDGEDEEVELEEVAFQRNEKPTQSSIVPTQQTLAVLQVAREQAILANKENIDSTRRAYNDKQAHAKRLDWDDSQIRQKRTRQDTIDDDESDEFETDSRPQKRTRLPRPTSSHAVDDWVADNGDDILEEQASQRQLSNLIRTPRPTRAPPLTQPPPPPQRSPLQHRSRAIIPDPPSSSAPEPRRRQQPQPPPQRQRTISPARSSPSAAPESSAREHQSVNARAKATMRMRPLLNPTVNRGPQVRRAWTVTETERLFEMIATYGCAWAQILIEDSEHPDGPALQMRSQVQLKDKARNVKMDYLKAGAELPAGFSDVTIKNSDKQLLQELGLPWE